MTGFALAVLAVVLSCLVPPILARARWIERAPRAGVVLWQAVAIAAVLAALGAVLAAPEEMLRTIQGDDGVRFGPALFIAAAVAAVGAGIIIVRLAVITVRLGLDTRRRRSRHRELLDLLDRPSPDERRVHVLAGPIPMAYCVPGRTGGERGRVVLTDSTVAVLPQPQVDAVIEHERAHLRARHDLVREAFTALHIAFPRVVRSKAALEAVDRLLEMLADDAALTRTDRTALQQALETLSAADASAKARRDRLQRPTSHGTRLALSGAAYVMSLAVIVLPTAVLAAPWLLRAFEAAFSR